MNKISILFLALFYSFLSEAQFTFPTDTITLQDRRIVIFSDKTWEYLELANSRLLFNSPVYDYVSQHYNWIDKWDTTYPYNYGNDLEKMNDTLAIVLLDDVHSDFCIPHNGIVTSKYKQRGTRFHYGTDVDITTGDTLKSCFDGIVRYSEFSSGGYGNLVVIRHYNGLETYYAHLDKLIVKPNEEVKSGQVIGLGGTTGRSTGSHLHFELRFFGNALNPEEVIDFENHKLISDTLAMHKGLFHESRNILYRPAAQQITNNSTSNNKTYYKIKSGDSLYALALKNKTTVNKICKLNGISENKVLKIGERIRIK